MDHRFFRIWLCLSLALVAGAAQADREACAALAADPDVVAGGVDFDDIVPDRAVPVCAAAVEADPADIESVFRLGRAHLAADAHDAARGLVEQAAAAGYPPAVNTLGVMHFNGWAMAQDDAAAFAEFERAHGLGYARATFNVAWFHRNGRVVAQDPALALSYYRQSAEVGFEPAAFELAMMLWQGDHGDPDPAAAARWLRQAAEGGYMLAQKELAQRLMRGDGVPQDDAEGYRFAVMAADAGDGYSAYLAGFALENGFGVEADLAAAAARYEAAGAAGDAVGQAAFGRMLAQGRGLEADPARARDVLRAAADVEVAATQAWLGRLLAMGQGGPKDVAAALPLLEAAGDDPVALHARGALIYRGDVVAQNRLEGLVLLRLAADAGFAEAQVDAAIILGGEGAGPEATATAVRYLERAAEQEEPRGLFLYALRLARGDGVERNEARAVELLERAARLGEEDAGEAMELVRASMDLRAQQAGRVAEMCRLQITLCNRGCDRQPDGTFVYNTRDGQHWFRPGGQLIPEEEAPGRSCPQ